MASDFSQNSITISREEAKKSGGFVILPIKEYEKLREQAMPTFYLKGKEAKELDKLVEGGLREYKEGKIIKADSLKDALEKYGRKKNQRN